MTQILLTTFAFIVTILFLVTIHEYGHYAVARFFGVKIEKFSVGFGRPIIKWYNCAGVEFSVSWIPLGGYVKMHGENPYDKTANEAATEAIPDTDISDFTKPEPTGKAFSDLPPMQRLLIAFAGPAVNFLFTILVLWGAFIVGKEGAKPMLGHIQASSPLLVSGLREGDAFVSVNGEKTFNDQKATLALVGGIGNRDVPITFSRGNLEQKAQLDLSALPVGSEIGIDRALGFEWAYRSELKQLYPAKIGKVVENTPAKHAGLRANDEIKTINGQRVNTWLTFTEIVSASPNKSLNITVARDNQTQALTLTPRADEKNPNIGFAGVAPAAIEPEKGKALFAKFRTIERYGVFAALPRAISETGYQAVFLLKSLGKVITGHFSVKNLGGPLSIADYSGKSMQAGWFVYLNYLAMISLTLAVMNLLPIPVLDGGHIVLCVIEMLRGKPLPEKAVDIAMRIGISILLSFMAMVIFLDLGKYLG